MFSLEPTDVLALFFRAAAEMHGIFGKFSPGIGSGITVVVATVVVVGSAAVVVVVCECVNKCYITFRGLTILIFVGPCKVLNKVEILPHVVQSVPPFLCALESPHQLELEHHLVQITLTAWHVEHFCGHAKNTCVGHTI